MTRQNCVRDSNSYSTPACIQALQVCLHRCEGLGQHRQRCSYDEKTTFLPHLLARFVPIAALSAKDEDEGREAGYNGEEGAMKQVRLK